MKKQPLYFGLPINIQDILTARTVEWERLKIHSIPGPDRSIRDEDMKNRRFVSRRYRNRRIGEFLKELDLAEGRGTGIPKMMHALEGNGSPLPVFHTDEHRSFFLTELIIQPAFAQASKPAKAPQVTPQVTPQVLKLLEALVQPLTRQEIQEKLKLLDREHFRKHVLRPALQAGLVSMVNPEKPNAANQRYRLTPLGRELLSQSNK